MNDFELFTCPVFLPPLPLLLLLLLTQYKQRNELRLHTVNVFGSTLINEGVVKIHVQMIDCIKVVFSDPYNFSI